MKNIFLFGNH